MAIIVSKDGKNAQKYERTNFQYEGNLQDYIFQNPESIPFYEIEDDLKLLLIAREFQTTSGPIDILAVDGSGELYVIETKLFKNSDKRFVVAQVLDYATALWNYSRDFDNFLENLEKHIKTSLKKKIEEYFEIADSSDFFSQLYENLQSGTFKFVVFMDVLPQRLKDLILFLNQNSSFSIYGVEMEYYVLDNCEILIPKLFGSEIKKEIDGGKSSRKRKWNESSFFIKAEENLNETELKALTKLYEFSKRKSDEISWGRGFARGSFNPKYWNISSRSIYSVFTDGSIQINFGFMDDNKQSSKHREFLREKLEAEIGLSIVNDKLENSFPQFTKERLLIRVDALIKIIEDLLDYGENNSDSNKFE